MNSRPIMLGIIEQNRQKNSMENHYQRLLEDQNRQTADDDYMALVEQYMKDHLEISKSEAMRMASGES